MEFRSSLREVQNARGDECQKEIEAAEYHLYQHRLRPEPALFSNDEETPGDRSERTLSQVWCPVGGLVKGPQARFEGCEVHLRSTSPGTDSASFLAHSFDAKGCEPCATQGPYLVASSYSEPTPTI